jgi:hypothetical protein
MADQGRRGESSGRKPIKAPGIPTWAWGLLLPAVTLTCAYVYWVGYASVFMIPFDLISVQVGDAFAAFAALGVAFLALNGLVALGNRAVPHLPWWIRQPLANLLTQLIFLFLFALALRQNLALAGAGVVSLLLLAPAYLLPLVTQRAVSGYGAKLKAEMARIRELPYENPLGDSIVDRAMERFPEVVRPLALAAMIIALASAAGIGSALARTSFLASSSSPQQVLVAVIGNRAYLRSVGATATGQLEVRSADNLPPMNTLDHVTRDQLRSWHLISPYVP